MDLHIPTAEKHAPLSNSTNRSYPNVVRIHLVHDKLMLIQQEFNIIIVGKLARDNILILTHLIVLDQIAQDALIQTLRIKKKFHSYCSPTCYWIECSTLTKTKMSLLNANDLDYIGAHQRFISMLPQAKVQAIFRLQMPKNLVEAHQNLKKQIATQNNLPLNRVTHKMFHGTKSNCDPLQFLNRLSPLCSNGCGLCGIVTQGNNTAYSRYNGQMWFANHASTSSGYCSGGSANVIFMVDVLAPTANSILIVGQNAATLPRFLILYR
jgi:hypothetical protein